VNENQGNLSFRLFFIRLATDEKKPESPVSTQTIIVFRFGSLSFYNKAVKKWIDYLKIFDILRGIEYKLFNKIW